MTSRTWRLVAALAAAALTLSACGESDSTDQADQGSGESPGIGLTVEEDPMAGHNLFIELENFTITPENASTDPVSGEGHLHLYVDGERTLRFYNTAIHLGDLSPGEHTLAVEVSQNDHSAYELDGEPIRATATVTVPETAAEHDPGNHGHGHSDVVDFDGDNPPVVDVTVAKDPKSGWNISATVENFSITPENASTDPVDGEGHLHLYVDGQKVTRLYGTDWHIASLEEGTHDIEIEVSHNNHAAYGVDGEPLRGSATVEVSAEDAAGGGHDHGHSDDGHDGEAMADNGLTIDDADIVIEASVADGEVKTGSDRVEIEVGSTVAVVLTSDVSDEVHVHGYDRFLDLEPGQQGTLVFVADAPGLFEIELEEAGTLLFELQIS